MQGPVADECQVERVKRDKGNSLFSYFPPKKTEQKTSLLSIKTLAIRLGNVFINTVSKHRHEAVGCVFLSCFLLMSFPPSDSDTQCSVAFLGFTII